jgi:monovalent cation/proton antiporter MnhG/PhaG subunit
MSALAHLAIIVLVGVAAAITLLCAIGVLVMRDAYQRLHYLSPPATVSAFLIVLAVALDGGGVAATIKVILVAVVLTLLNGVVSHACARAFFVREHGRWPPRDEEQPIPLVGPDGKERSP